MGLCRLRIHSTTVALVLYFFITGKNRGILMEGRKQQQNANCRERVEMS